MFAVEIILTQSNLHYSPNIRKRRLTCEYEDLSSDVTNEPSDCDNLRFYKPLQKKNSTLMVRMKVGGVRR